jgi:hypothetical protein
LEEIPSSSVAPLHKTEKTVLTPFQSLQHTREKVKESFTSLSVNCSSYGTKEAILNAQSHYDELLCIMRRFLENSKHPLSRQTISTFIIHCIQHGFLGAEQMLSALEREGNQIADRNELNMILNHDLIRILINCPLEAGPIPQNLREWIRYARLGEYWLRDLNACEVGNPSVQNLLAKLKLFAESNNAFTAENLIEEALGFAEKSALLCENLQLQIDALKTQPSAQQKQLAQSFKKSFRSACQSVSNACTHLSITSEKSSLSSNPVKELIEKIRKTTLPNTIAYTLFDIASNHLPHLEAELQSQLYLNPFEARLHLRTVLRLNQHIVEKVLRALLSEYQPERNFRLEEHDLSVMVLALGMDQIDFSQEEWDWLNAGKMIHQMTRYLESYNSTQTNRKTDLVKKVEKTFYGADEIAQKQSMDNHYGLDQGFTIADKEISYKLDAVKDLAKDDLALMHSILDKIFSKVIR